MAAAKILIMLVLCGALIFMSSTAYASRASALEEEKSYAFFHHKFPGYEFGKGYGFGGVPGGFGSGVGYGGGMGGDASSGVGGGSGTGGRGGSGFGSRNGADSGAESGAGAATGSTVVERKGAAGGGSH